MQSDLFNHLEERYYLKEIGMRQATDGREDILQVARDCAELIAKSKINRLCSADDVAKKMDEIGYDYSNLGNAAGSIFRRKCWKFTGDYKPSNRTSAHARDIKIWRLT